MGLFTSSSSFSSSSTPASLSTSPAVASAHSNLGFAQGIGIGVAVSFVGALVLAIFSAWVLRNRYNVQIEKKSKKDPPIGARPGYYFKEPKQANRKPPWAPSWGCDMYPDGRHNFRRRPYRDIPGQRIHALTTLGCLEHQIGEDPLYIWGFVERCIETDKFSTPPDVVKDLLDEEKLVRLAGPPINPGTWVELISSLETRQAGIACFMAQILVPRMHPAGDIDKTFLPRSMLSWYREMCRLDPSSRCYGEHGSGNLWDLVHVLREVIGSLYNGSYSVNTAYPDREIMGKDPRDEMIDSLVASIADAVALDRIRAGELEDTTYKLLRYVVGLAANVAITLFSQPGEWTYDFNSDEPGVLFFPAIHLDLETWTVDSKAKVATLPKSDAVKQWLKPRNMADAPEGKELLPQRWPAVWPPPDS